MIKVRFLPAAEIELLKEVAYYSKARSGTGVRFQLAVQAEVKNVHTVPPYYPTCFSQVIIPVTAFPILANCYDVIKGIGAVNALKFGLDSYSTSAVFISE